MRLLSLGLLVVSAIALAGGPPRKVTIKKRSGEIVTGTIVSEMDTGYLIKLEAPGKGAGKTVAVKFEEVADFSEGSAPLQAAAVVVPPPPAALPPPPPTPSAPPPPPAYAPPAAPTGPCASNEVHVTFDEEDDVIGAVCALRTEVTVAEYQACVSAGACTVEGLGCGPVANWGKTERLNHPINCVTAQQAQAYCSWHRMRLPSLLEFQALAAAPKHDSDFPWGDNEPNGRVCWSGERERRGTCAAGSFPTAGGRGGILDIVGNVWEWTSTEKRGARVAAGGAWNESRSNRIERYAENRQAAGEHSEDVGFRCVRAVR